VSDTKQRQAEYLQAMGVDLYVHRQSAEAAINVELRAVDEPRAVDPLKAVDKLKAVENTEEAIESGAESPVQTEVKDSAVEQISEPAVAVELEQTGADTPEPEKAAAEQPSSNSKPLHFLWQQQGRYLFLSAQTHKASPQEAQLLDAIVRSIASSNSSERGEGKWPLTDSQQSSDAETQEFLRSFVEGRSELCGTEIVLVLFGEQSFRQFSEVEGDFAALLGKTLSSEGKIEEMRPVPELAEMLVQPQLKSLTWQSIRDLKISS
jgi:hypothetical protein